MPRSFDNLWSLGFGQPSEETLILWGNSIGSGSVISTIAANVVVANSPHLIFSLIYFQWNAIFTSMLIGKEWNDFSLKSKPLRVSDRPQGKQRSRYFLQLPFKFSIPLIITSMLLHWIISQCIFVVSVEQIMRYVSPQQISWGILTCGYSPIAIMTVLLASLTIPVSVFVLGWRRLPGLMPVAGSCSLAIAAACHNRAAGTYPDVTQDVLKWGVMKDWKREQQSQEELTQEEDDGGDHGLSQTTSGCGHCGFSNAVVDDPQEGVAYE